jgi:hypothetical protein
MVLTMCSFYGGLFEPEDPGNPTREEIDIARKNAELARMGDELLDRLGKLHTTGDAPRAENFIPPPVTVRVTGQEMQSLQASQTSLLFSVNSGAGGGD